MFEQAKRPTERRDPRSLSIKKRRYREDENVIQDRHSQRRRYEEPPLTILRRVLLGLAEPASRRSEDDIDTVVKLLSELLQHDGSSRSAIQLILQFVIEQPMKIPFVARAIVLLNESSHELARQIIVAVTTAAGESVVNGCWRALKLQLRLLACCQSILEGDGVFAFLHDLFSTAITLQSASEDDKLGLELTKIILLTIPYTMASIDRVSPDAATSDQAASLLEKTDVIASTPHPLEALVNPLTNHEQSQQPPSVISLLQKQLQSEASQGWPLKCLLRPWVNARTRDSMKLPTTVAKHRLPAIDIPARLQSDPTRIFPELYFSVYAEQEIQTVPSPLSITSTLVRDVLTDTINCLDFNRNVVARLLVDIDCYFAEDIFVKRAVPYDQLREVADGNLRYKPEDVAIDAVFALLFQLPASEHLPVYYHAVLTETCKIAPAAVAPSLGRAIREVYKRLPELDIELYQRFLDWFSHHLSNFGFMWKWAEWQNDVTLSNLNPKKAFISGVLEKEIRLSFPKRIRGNVPEAYHELITKSNELDVPDFKYNSHEVPFSSEAREIAQMIRRKAPDEEIQIVLRTISGKAAELGMMNPSAAAIDALMTAICHIGSKSLSHVLSYVDRCRERLLLSTQESDAGKRQVIRSVLEYWREQPGVGISILDKLLNYSILTPISIIDWALTHDETNGRQLSHSFVYELFHNTIIKVTSRIRTLARRVKERDKESEQEREFQKDMSKMRKESTQLLAAIETQLIAFLNGGQDEMVQDVAVPDGEAAEVRWWAAQWSCANRRLFAVEDAVISDLLEARDLQWETRRVEEGGGVIDGERQVK